MLNDSNLSGEDVFVAIFAMFFGAYAAGQASTFGPDIGKEAADETATIIELSGVRLCVGVLADILSCEVDLWLSSLIELCSDVSSSDLTNKNQTSPGQTIHIQQLEVHYFVTRTKLQE